MDSLFAQAFVSSHVGELHVQQPQLFPANHLGMRMPAVRTGPLHTRRLEVVATILAVMPHWQDLHRQQRAFGHSAASSSGKDRLQSINVKHPASTNCEMNG